MSETNLSQAQPRIPCPNCQRLIEWDDAMSTAHCPYCGVTDAPPATTPPTPSSQAAPDDAAATLDLRGYTLLEALGKGGMGEVYRCDDPALGRDLAIKIIRSEYCGNADFESRFLREARITGSLQHPGIVPIHNLGRLVDGRLHYTMRLVQGRTLAHILRGEAGQAQHWPELLTIFVKICQAVAYAHNKHIIHRDLKPGNVMVGQFGEVQVMDWGLAKVLPQDSVPSGGLTPSESSFSGDLRPPLGTPMDTPNLTRIGAGIGTPAYMPPEQARGDWDRVDERADVFALGAILCEILPGLPPYASGEVFERAKHGDVSEARTCLEQCGADAALVTLCRECLSPQCEDRPRHAGVLAQRMADYQTDVQARLQKAEVERGQALVKADEERKRRRLFLTSTLLLLAAALLAAWLAVRAGTAEKKAVAERDDKEAALQQAQDAAQAERTAKQKAEDAAQAERRAAKLAQNRLGQIEKANEVLRAIFHDLDPTAEEKGGPNLRQQLSQHLERAAKQLEEAAIEAPVAIARLQNTLGMSLVGLGQTQRAIELLSKARATLEAKLGADHPDTLRSRNNLAATYQSAGRTADAIRLFEQTLKQMEAKLGVEHPHTILFRNHLAVAYWEVKKLDRSIPLFEQTLRQRETKLGPDHPSTLLTMANLGVNYRDAGRLTDAMPLLESALERGRRRRGGLPASLDWVPDALAQTYERAKQFAKAEAIYRDFLQQAQTQLGPDDPRTAGTLAQLGGNLLQQKKFTDAESVLRQCLTIREKKLPDAWNTFNTRSALGEALAGQKKYKEAEPLLLQGYEGMKKRQDKIPPPYRKLRLTEARQRLVQLYDAWGKKDQADHWRKPSDSAAEK